jgi:hypothetical protein
LIRGSRTAQDAAGPCSKSSPEVNDCLKNLISKLYAAPENKKNTNVVKTDKLVIESTKDFKVDGTLDNVEFRGFNNLQFNELTGNNEVCIFFFFLINFIF